MRIVSDALFGERETGIFALGIAGAIGANVLAVMLEAMAFFRAVRPALA